MTRFLTLASALAGLFTFLHAADTAVLTAVADTSIFEPNSDNNLGGLSNVPLGPINQSAAPDGTIPEGRMLVRFDLAGRLPAGAVVTSARLQFFVTKERFSGPAMTADVHRLLVPWGEGTGSGGSTGTTAGTGEASWIDRIKGTAAWGTPGGASGTDYVAEPSDSRVLEDTGNSLGTSSPGLVSDVNAWLADPSSNHGWILVARRPHVQGSAKRIDTREGATAGPTLSLTFEVPPPPAPLQFDPVVLTDGRLQLRFHAEPGNIYEVQRATDPTASQWQALTSFIVKLQPLEAQAEDAVTEDARFYRIVITGQVD